MANEAGNRSSPAPGQQPARAALLPGTFPSGTALLALAISFVMVRLVVPYTTAPRRGPGPPPAPSVTTARIAVAAGILGALLAAGGVLATLLEGGRVRTRAAWALTGLRVAFAAPVVLLVLFSLGGDPPEQLKWWSLYGAGATIVSSLGVGIVRARGMWLARGALALLLVGEMIELAWPPAHLTVMPATYWPRLLDRLAPYSEVAAIVGAVLALAWAVASTRRIGGTSRLWMLLPFPALIAVLLSTLATSVRRRFAVVIANATFGVRFDLIAGPERGINPSVWQLLMYLLVPELLIAAAMISLGAMLNDRGASTRRALGWLAILLGGFGGLTLAAPMDPTRLITVCLGVVLLERAATIEAEGRKAAE